MVEKVVVKGRLAKFDKVDISKVFDKNCKLCSHVKVCAVFRAVKPLLENWEEQDRPFEAEVVAKICKEFRLAVNDSI